MALINSFELQASIKNKERLDFKNANEGEDKMMSIEGYERDVIFCMCK